MQASAHIESRTNLTKLVRDQKDEEGAVRNFDGTSGFDYRAISEEKDMRRISEIIEGVIW